MSKSLLKELISFVKNEKISMHIPGHKSGRGLSACFEKYALKLDVTELSGTDNLQNPKGVLKNAQDNCAKVFGSERTYFLTSGSSLGLRAAVLGCASRGAKLIVDRTCHKSVIAAVSLGGVTPVFVYPDFDREKGLYLGVSVKEITRAIIENPDVCGAIITSPTYYGICSDIAEISKILHKNNKFLIVDEAHGAHFAFNKKLLPISALTLGADICVQSAHKTLPALGQCSFMHVGVNAKIDIRRLERTLRLIQTTSPSYMLMTALDEAVRYMNTKGRFRLSFLIREIEDLKTEVTQKTDLIFADIKTVGRVQDATRIVVDFSPIGISGQDAEAILIDEFGIYAEMSDAKYVVLIPSVATRKREIRQLCDALCSIGSRRFKDGKVSNNIPLPEIEMITSPAEAISKPYECVDNESAVGRISASVLSACPPGAAVLIPGQRIGTAEVEYIKKNNIADEIEVIIE